MGIAPASQLQNVSFFPFPSGVGGAFSLFATIRGTRQRGKRKQSRNEARSMLISRLKANLAKLNHGLTPFSLSSI